MNNARPIRCHLPVALALLLLAITPRLSPASTEAAALPATALTLEDCSRLALARNPGLLSSEQDVVSAGASLMRARSSYSPQLSLDALGSVQHNGSGVSGASGTESTQQVELDLSQMLWQSGRREQVGESRSRLTAAKYGYAEAVQSLLQQVASDYYGVLASDRLITVQEEGVASAASHLDQVQARISAGATAAVEVYTAQDDLAQAELALVDARRNAAVARAQLKTIMGVGPLASLHLAEPPPLATQALPTLEEALPTAQQHRPDLRRATSLTEAAQLALQQARINRGPVTGINANYHWGYLNWESQDPSWLASLSLSLPLFDGGATRAEVVAAQAALVSAQAQWQSLTNQAGLEVERALAEAQRAQVRLGATATAVTAAAARLHAAEGKYQQGVGTLLEVTDARVSLTTARTSQVQAEYDYRASLVVLAQALGTLAPPRAVQKLISATEVN